jgi:hypothetical protein
MANTMQPVTENIVTPFSKYIAFENIFVAKLIRKENTVKKSSLILGMLMLAIIVVTLILRWQAPTYALVNTPPATATAKPGSAGNLDQQTVAPHHRPTDADGNGEHAAPAHPERRRCSPAIQSAQW